MFVGLVIGAGFASGQELMNFFAKHGKLGILGILLSGLVIFLTGKAVTEICIKKKIKSNNDFINLIFGKAIGKVINIVVIAFLFILFGTMLAGSGAVFSQSFGFNYSSGVIIIGVLCFITFLFDMKGIIQINVVLVPLMVTGFIMLGIYTAILKSVPAFAIAKNLGLSFVFSALVYSSYNLITAIPVLAELSKETDDIKTASGASFISTLILTVSLLLFMPVTLSNFNMLSSLEIPMLELAKRHGALLEYIYLFVIACAIYTTAVANGFVVIEWLSGKTGLPKTLIKAMVTISGMLIAHIGFSSFVGKVYPVFGFIGIVEIATILFRYFAMKVKSFKQKNTPPRPKVKRPQCAQNKKQEETF